MLIQKLWSEGTNEDQYEGRRHHSETHSRALECFSQRNHHAIRNCELLRIDGIDGSELIKSNINTRLIAPSAHQGWSPGAIGIGLSHLLCWRLCSQSAAPLVVLEDDVLLADSWQIQLEQLLHPGAGMVLLGWNLDSMLRAELNDQQEMISLFEPAYPSENSLRAIVNSDNSRQSKRLRNAFGLPGYWLKPSMANLLASKIKCLESLPLKLGRGFPEISTHGIDSLLNLHYQQIGGEVVMPPIALALNDPLITHKNKTNKIR